MDISLVSIQKFLRHISIFRLSCTILFCAAFFLSTMSVPAVQAQSLGGNCGYVITSGYVGGPAPYCQIGTTTLLEGNYHMCLDGINDVCCPQNFTCPNQTQLPLVQCGDDTTYTRGTKSCSCSEDELPNGQICCGFFDPSSAIDKCKTSDTGARTCGESTSVIFGSSPAPNNCYCGGWFKTSSNLTSGDTFCCGVQDPNNPTACNKTQQFVCGDKITYAGSGTPQNAYACNCAETNWFKNQESTASPTYCCGWFSASMPYCSPTKIPNARCLNTSGCGFCDDPQQYCTVAGGFATCTTRPGQCEAPLNPPPPSVQASCGERYDPTQKSCPASCGKVTVMSGNDCCGWFDFAQTDECSDQNPLDPSGGNGGGTSDTPQPEATPSLNIFDGPTAGDFAALNPLVIFNSPFVAQFSSPAGIINRALLFIFPLAGLILFVMLLWGGFEMITGATNSKSMEAGKQRITAALMGFFLLFCSFWIIQIVEYIFNLAIL